jgi:hypothetical protein
LTVAAGVTEAIEESQPYDLSLPNKFYAYLQATIDCGGIARTADWWPAELRISVSDDDSVYFLLKGCYGFTPEGEIGGRLQLIINGEVALDRWILMRAGLLGGTGPVTAYIEICYNGTTISGTTGYEQAGISGRSSYVFSAPDFIPRISTTAKLNPPQTGGNYGYSATYRVATQEPFEEVRAGCRECEQGVPGCIYCANSREPRNGYEVLVNGITRQLGACDCVPFNGAYYFGNMYMPPWYPNSCAYFGYAFPRCGDVICASSLHLISDSESLYRIQFLLTFTYQYPPWYPAKYVAWEKAFDSPPYCTGFDDDLSQAALPPEMQPYTDCAFPETVHLRSLL